MGRTSVQCGRGKRKGLVSEIAERQEGKHLWAWGQGNKNEIPF